MAEAVSDFVIVGAGQNTLTAAAYLAAAGNSVTVLERHPYWGGGCITHEVTLPGFRHDLHATNVFMARANPLVRLDELGLLSQFGLRYADREAASHGTVFDDGSAIALYKDLERSCDSIGRYSSSDAKAYREFMLRTLKYIPLFSMALFLPPANGATFRKLLAASAEGRYLLDFFNASTIDVIDQNFTHERTKVHMLRLATEMMMRADAPGSAFGLMFMAGLYHSYPPGFVVGGSQGFSDALVRCLQHHGGEIVTGAEVNQVTTDRGRATGVTTTDGRRYSARLAVIAGLVPWKLSDYVAGTEALTERCKQVPTSDYTCFLTHLALDEAPLPATPPEFQSMGFTVVAPIDYDAMVRMTYDAQQGHVPRDFSASYVCASNGDPSRAPAGKSTLYLYRTVPTLLAGQPLEAWDSIAEATGDDLVIQTARYIPNLTPRTILGRRYESPLDIQRESPSYQNGDVASLAMTPDQFMGGRPIPELADYRVPGVNGLYLCGPFMHPGGGANGGGRPVAIKVMMDLGMKLDKVFQL
ncbi:MAG: Phytoene dehydrogenase [Hydrocarboniphaga sp.]|uniref:phytoene desaturase family protein n=1 Tax=Hydrocarboniphaga sp. TaxID=2033016 RepID=UPI002602DE0F|nr:NAD(P)/FAD-dependent oxidoreductase [Hydrocarboniphaga sp.]MDB5971490.1 Phytoene dehydrogenase [Hydrocarboniphaga sp.]